MSVIDGESTRVYNKTLNGLDTLGDTEVGDLTVTGDLLVEGASSMEDGLDMNSTKITQLANGTAATDAVNLSQLSSTVGAYLPLAGGTMTNSSSDINMNSADITGITDIQLKGVTYTFPTALGAVNKVLGVSTYTSATQGTLDWISTSAAGGALLADGSVSMDTGADLDMNSNTLINLKAASANGEAVRYNEFNTLSTTVSTNSAAITSANTAITNNTTNIATNTSNIAGKLSNPATGDLNMDSNKITNLANGTASNDAVNLSQLSSTVGAYLPLAGGTMTGEIDMGSDKIINLTDGTAAQDAVSKSQMDTAISTAGAAFLPLAGGTMTGDLNMNGNDINNIGSVSQYSLPDNYGFANRFIMSDGAGGTLWASAAAGSSLWSENGANLYRNNRIVVGSSFASSALYPALLNTASAAATSGWNAAPVANQGIGDLGVDNCHLWLGNSYSTNSSYWGLAMGVSFDGWAYLQVLNQLSNTYYNLALQPSGGYVGIGTTAPESALHIVSNRNNTPTTKGIHLGQGGTDDYAIEICAGGSTKNSYIDFTIPNNDRRGRMIYTHTDDNFIFYTGSSVEGLRINNVGNVGIGDNNPDTLLTVGGSIRCHDGASMRIGANSLNNIRLHHVSNNSYIDFNTGHLHFRASSTNQLVINNDGRLFLGGNINVNNNKGIFFHNGTDWYAYGMYRASGSWSFPYTPLAIVCGTGVRIVSRNQTYGYIGFSNDDGDSTHTSALLVKINTYDNGTSAQQAGEIKSGMNPMLVAAGNIGSTGGLNKVRNISGVSHTTTGTYTVTFARTRPTNTYVVNVSPNYFTGSNASAHTYTTGSFIVQTWAGTSTLLNMPFAFTVTDWE